MTLSEAIPPSKYEILRFSSTHYAILHRSTQMGAPEGSYDIFMENVGGKTNATFVLKALREKEARQRDERLQRSRETSISEVSEE